VQLQIILTPDGEEFGIGTADEIAELDAAGLLPVGYSVRAL
jgi:hypothetical protein